MNKVLRFPLILACVASSFSLEAAWKYNETTADPFAGSPEGERIALWPEGKVPEMEAHQRNNPFIEWFVPEKKTTDAVMILSCGGGYDMCAWRTNGVSSAMFRDWMLDKGMTVVRLHYRTPRNKNGKFFKAAWQDAQRAVRLVRDGASKHGVSPGKIGFYGFSAAGHQALLMAVSSGTNTYEKVDALDDIPCNVNWAIAFYPAYAVRNIKKRMLNPEFTFDSPMPPVLLVHGDIDNHTPMASLYMYEALHERNVPVELHILATRGHSLMVNAEPGTPSDAWKDTVWRWLVQMKFCR